MRDSKLRGTAAHDGGLRFTEAEFDAFLEGVRADETEDVCLKITQRGDGTFAFRRRDASAVELEFTMAEVAAFFDGIANHEFSRWPTKPDNARSFSQVLAASRALVIEAQSVSVSGWLAFGSRD